LYLHLQNLLKAPAFIQIRRLTLPLLEHPFQQSFWVELGGGAGNEDGAPHYRQNSFSPNACPSAICAKAKPEASAIQRLKSV
jgi:hypothetical protein